MRAAIKCVVAIVLVLTVSACAPGSAALVDDGFVALEIEKSNGVEVSFATVGRQGREFFVRGEARFPFRVEHGIFSGHIDVELVTPDGQVFEERDVRLARRRIPRMRGRRASFVARFPFELTRGTVVKIRYHEGEHPEI